MGGESAVPFICSQASRMARPVSSQQSREHSYLLWTITATYTQHSRLHDGHTAAQLKGNPRLIYYQFMNASSSTKSSQPSVFPGRFNHKLARLLASHLAAELRLRSDCGHHVLRFRRYAHKSCPANDIRRHHHTHNKVLRVSHRAQPRPARH